MNLLAPLQLITKTLFERNSSSFEHDLARNSTWSIFGFVVSQAFGFITWALVGRYLGAEVLGQYTLGLAICGLVFNVINLGLQHILTREIARSPDAGEQYLSNALGIELS